LFEEASKTVIVNAACYRDIIENFQDNFSDTFSEPIPNGQIRARWGSLSYCPSHYALLNA